MMVYPTNFWIMDYYMMNESIIYGFIIGAFTLIDLFQHYSYHVALLKLFKSHPLSLSLTKKRRPIFISRFVRVANSTYTRQNNCCICGMYRIQYVVVVYIVVVIGLLERPNLR